MESHTGLNRYAEAFKENFNVIGLTTAAAASLALMATPLMPVPLLIGAVAEAAYLLFVPDSRWYQLRLAKRFDAEVEKRRAEIRNRILPQLQPDLQARFQRLEDVRRSLADQMQSGTDGEQPSWYREVLRKLDFLLEKFLHFAGKDAQFRKYLESVLTQECGQDAVGSINLSLLHKASIASRNARNQQPQAAQLQSGRGLAGALPPTAPVHGGGRVPDPPVGSTPLNASSLRKAKSQNNPANNGTPVDTDPKTWSEVAIERIQLQYDRELGDIRSTADNEQDSSTRAVLEKRLDVLQRRREFIGKIGRIQTNLNHQLHLVEDTFGLISDEIRAQPPEQVLADINDVVSQTNTMTQLLEEFAPLEHSLNF